jgi:hypothetical protein
MISGIRFYQIYLATKLHFTSSYDAFKFKGKVPDIEKRYDRLKGNPLFERWKNRVKDSSHAAQVALANQLIVGSNWVFDMTIDDAISIYTEWNKTHDAISYHSTEDFTFIRSLFEKGKLKAYDDLIQKTKNGHPPLLQLYLANRVLPDTVVALNVLRTPFLDNWIEEYKIDPAISAKVFALHRYTPYMKESLPLIRESYKAVFSQPKKEP